MAVEAPVVQRIALVAGGTGMTGRALLKLLLTGGDYARIHAVSRRPVPLDHPRLANRILPLEQIQARLTGSRVNDAFCCLGAPQARAGTLAELRPVETWKISSWDFACECAVPVLAVWARYCCQLDLALRNGG